MHLSRVDAAELESVLRQAAGELHQAAHEATRLVPAIHRQMLSEQLAAFAGQFRSVLYE